MYGRADLPVCQGCRADLPVCQGCRADLPVCQGCRADLCVCLRKGGIVMHEGCTGSFGNGKMVVDKIRMMGFNTRPMPAGVNIKCVECENEFEMTHLETKCPHCNMVYGVTPCSVAYPERIKAAGIDY